MLGGLNNPAVTSAASELWGAKRPAGPPPGLSKGGGGGGVNTINGWNSNISSAATGGGGGWGQPPRNNWNASPWLLLRNLTAQVHFFFI